MESDVPSTVWTDAFADFTCIARFDGRNLVLQTASVGFRRVTGYSVEEFNARGGVPFLLLPEDIFVALNGLERLVAGEQAGGEVRMTNRQGEIRCLRYVARPVRDTDEPSILYIHGAAQDVTERMRTGAALQESEERFRQLAENIHEVFWMSDQLRTQILYVSPAYEQVWGRTCQSLYDEPWSFFDAVHSQDRDAVAVVLERQGRGEPTDLEFRIVRPDGSVRWVRDRTFPVRNAQGKAYRVAGIAADVTERRRLEGQLRQAQKMEAIGRLAGGVAHDFNNLLTVILGYSDLLREYAGLDEQTRSLLGQVHEAGIRAARLTQQLLALGRRSMVQPRLLDLNGIINGMEGLLRPLVGADVDLRILPGADLQAVYGDAGQLEQVVMNLVLNARDAMSKGGKLTLTTGNTYLDEEFAKSLADVKPGRYVLLTVADTGCGMDREMLADIFEPFFTTKDVGKGTGLGLSVVYGVVRQASGHIEVDSQPGYGSTFRIYLPAADAPAPAAAAPARTGLPSGTETLLLVEDEEGVRGFARHALERCGYTVLSAGNGQEALELAAKQTKPIDLLVTDVVMPRMGGPELAERMRATAPAMKVLYLSGYTGDIVVRHGVHATDQAFLQKPFTPEALTTKVRELLDRHM